jgi:predicted site-specific integrase-resolvase
MKGSDASVALGVHQRTLHLWDKNGKIETIRSPGGWRLYNVEKFLKDHDIEDSKYNTKEEKCIRECINDSKVNDIIQNERLKICYIRVSSISQKDDLERQRQYMKIRYPNHIFIEDIGSGMNLNKRGIRKIIKLAIAGKVDELVVAYKDRLSRFGYELIEDLIDEYSHGKIIVVNEDKDIEPEEELIKDTLQIMNIFVAKMNGLRKYSD